MSTPGKTTLKRTQRDYSLAFKLDVVSQVEKGKLTYKQAQQHYGIQGRSTVLVWLRKHGKLDWSRPRTHSPVSISSETPAQKIKRLERELANAEARNMIYDDVVVLVKNEYGIDLEKKYLAERFGKPKR
ncbi:hypothetical protein GMA8713_02627 [Grimontia marina]|uniref:Transposase n=1 Tax=Grimontia marina TaxID=646534 RepID=A0A128F9A2_9GAMM|nr:hypothetical protein GMA8713_02627 [Grimontia marina]